MKDKLNNMVLGQLKFGLIIILTIKLIEVIGNKYLDNGNRDWVMKLIKKKVL